MTEEFNPPEKDDVFGLEGEVGPDQLSFDSEEEKQEFLEEVADILSGRNDIPADQPEKDGTDEATEPELVIGLTPMGTVGVRVTDENGNSVSYFISDPTEAWELSGHLNSLATIMVQTRYAMAMQEQRMIEEMMKKQDLYIPGHGKIG